MHTRAGAPVRTGIPTEAILGALRVGSEDRLHMLLRTARAGDADALAQLAEMIRLAARDPYRDLVTGFIVPVPAHLPGSRGRVVEVAAQELSLARGWPVRTGALLRLRPVVEAKAGGVRDPDAEAPSLRWRPPDDPGVIVLVDDVVRSGGTLLAAERAIRAAGEHRPIVAIVVCRAVPAVGDPPQTEGTESLGSAGQ
jgi:predicted amidophosphoribosyltransferase